MKSVSVVALSPAISIVTEAEISRIELNKLREFRYGPKRMRRNTPAVTRVDEWTNAETGVGAAIAAGSHLENGA